MNDQEIMNGSPSEISDYRRTSLEKSVTTEVTSENLENGLARDGGLISVGIDVIDVTKSNCIKFDCSPSNFTPRHSFEPPNCSPQSSLVAGEERNRRRCHSDCSNWTDDGRARSDSLPSFDSMDSNEETKLDHANPQVESSIIGVAKGAEEDEDARNTRRSRYISNINTKTVKKGRFFDIPRGEINASGRFIKYTEVDKDKISTMRLAIMIVSLVNYGSTLKKKLDLKELEIRGKLPHSICSILEKFAIMYSESCNEYVNNECCTPSGKGS